MHVRELDLRDFRSWPELNLKLEPGVTVFAGRNGHGKTNIVEAVHYSSKLSSHRVSTDAPLIHAGAENARVSATTVNDGRALTTHLLIKAHGANQAQINRTRLKSARELLGVLRVVMFSPEDLRLITGEPAERRKFLDGVSTCATCDGFFFKDQHIAVVGGGDSAMEEATFLTKFGSKVTLIHRSENFRASKIMLERARENDKIEFLTDTVVDSVVEADGKVGGLNIRNTVTGEESVLDATAMFVAIGHDPRSAFLDGQVAVDEGGYVEVAEPSTSTSVQGVFACGDLVDKTYRQAITAAGAGCRAALDAQHYLAAL